VGQLVDTDNIFQILFHPMNWTFEIRIHKLRLGIYLKQTFST